MEKAAAAEMRKDFQQGLAILTEAIRTFPQSAKLYNARANLHITMGKFAEANQDATKAKELASRSIRPDSFRAGKLKLADSQGPLEALPPSRLDMDAGFSLGSRGNGEAVNFRALEPAAQDVGLGEVQNGGVGGGAQEEASVRLNLQLRCNIEQGETVWVRGNHPAVGGRAGKVQLHTSKGKYPAWSAVVAIPQSALISLVYQFGTQAAGGGQTRWEEAVGGRSIPAEFARKGAAAGEITIDDGTFNEPAPEAAGGDSSTPSEEGRGGAVGRGMEGEGGPQSPGGTMVEREVAGALTIQASVTLQVAPLSLCSNSCTLTHARIHTGVIRNRPPS